MLLHGGADHATTHHLRTIMVSDRVVHHGGRLDCCYLRHWRTDRGATMIYLIVTVAVILIIAALDE